MKCYKWLLGNVGPLPEVVNNWTQTFSFRHDWIGAQRYPLVDDILRDWPILKTPVAPALILKDFESLGLVDGNKIQFWESFITIIMNENSCSISDSIGKTLQRSIDFADTTPTGRVLGQLLSLCHVFAPKGSLKRPRESTLEGPETSSHSKPSMKRASIPDAKDSLVAHVARVDDIKTVQAKKIKDAGRCIVQPYIIAVGSVDLMKTDKVFVSIDEFLYPLDSALKAIDFCFKAMHVFDAFYPPASTQIWHLIQLGLYQFETAKDTQFPQLAKILEKLRRHQYSST